MSDADTGNAELTPINLVDCGLEDLVAALLSRQPIATPVGGVPFILEDDNARRIFSYYARHRDLWPRAKTVQAREIEDVLKALEQDPPAKAATETDAAAPKKLWRLRRVEAHRFGGLHRHCGANGEDPEDFILDVERDVTLISGFNGAGKTALRNVMIWCLTGRALRSQHMPDENHEPMEVYWTGGGNEEGEGNESEFPLPPVVPIPSGADLEVLDDQPKINTWAQLTFHDEGSDDICVVRRALTGSTRGKLSMNVTGLEDLEVPDLAIEAGTLMPGIAAHMRFDEKTTFAQAIAQLTGLKPLEDLGRRSARVVRRLRTDETKKTESDAAAKLTDFKSKRQSIIDAWSALADLGDPADLIAPDEEAEKDECRKSIAETRRDLEQIEQELQDLDEPVMLMHPNMAKEYRRKVRGLIAALNKEDGRAEAGELIRALLDRIVLTPTNGALDVDLVGDLAGIMTLATGQKSKKPLQNRGLELSQIKVVAGAGFEPATFRL